MKEITMDLNGKYVLVAGSGKSGIAASELLAKKGIDFILYDGNKDLDTEELRKKAPVLMGVKIVLGDLADDVLDSVGLAVLSPGISLEVPFVCAIKERNIPIWGEIELAYYFGRGRLIGITGTNGKTTTTALTGEILGDYFDDVKVVGNIGIPYTSLAAEMTDDTVTVAEISSFQLETAHDFHPQVSAILNITPDHLNRHHTMECYISVKESITKNQNANDSCVLNYEDEELRRFGEEIDGRVNVVFFSSAHKLKRGLYLDGDEIVSADGKGTTTKIINVNELNILGTHNYENAMAATAAAMGMGVPVESIASSLKKFKAVEHRIEFVTEKNGIRFYNDSKGTNPDAAIKGICAMNRPTLLIGGGYDKESEYDEWIESFNGKVKKLVLIGQTRDKIAECARRHGFDQIILADTLEEAIDRCMEYAVPGDAVLLSPACASWGMFKNYEERGRIFKDYVMDL
jgi:UDP-N-acetylmuramoylalanine--D-glutamate ligase